MGLLVKLLLIRHLHSLGVDRDVSATLLVSGLFLVYWVVLWFALRLLRSGVEITVKVGPVILSIVALAVLGAFILGFFTEVSDVWWSTLVLGPCALMAMDYVKRHLQEVRNAEGEQVDRFVPHSIPIQLTDPDDLLKLAEGDYLEGGFGGLEAGKRRQT